MKAVAAARGTVQGGPLTPDDTPSAWDQRTTLLTMLQYTRDVAAAKCRDLAAEHVAVAPGTTSPLTTIGGIVNHLRRVEHSWIENRFVDRPDLGPWTGESPDQEFIDGAGAPIEDPLAAYAEQAVRTDRLIADLDLDLDD